MVANTVPAIAFLSQPRSDSMSDLRLRAFALGGFGLLALGLWQAAVYENPLPHLTENLNHFG